MNLLTQTVSQYGMNETTTPFRSNARTGTTLVNSTTRSSNTTGTRRDTKMNVQDAQSASNSTVMTGDVRVDIARKIYVGDKWHSGANKPLFAVREVTHDGRVREKLVVPPQIADMKCIERDGHLR